VAEAIADRYRIFLLLDSDADLDVLLLEHDLACCGKVGDFTTWRGAEEELFAGAELLIRLQQHML